MDETRCEHFVQFSLCGTINIMHYLIISAYSLSLPLLSLHLRNMTDASTLAGEKVLGSLSREITLSRIVLMMEEEHTNSQEMRTLRYQIPSWCKSERDFETAASLIPVQTEAIAPLFHLVAQLHAAPVCLGHPKRIHNSF